jgi:hypothetical protein
VREVDSDPLLLGAPGQVGPVFDLSLDDSATTGLEGATVTLPYDPAKAGGDEGDLRVFVFDEESQFWEPASDVQTVNEAANEVTADVEHFSYYVVFNSVVWRLSWEPTDPCVVRPEKRQVAAASTATSMRAAVRADNGLDSDGDGLSDCEERSGMRDSAGYLTFTSDPRLADTDGDRRDDGFEHLNRDAGFDPLFFTTEQSARSYRNDFVKGARAPTRLRSGSARATRSPGSPVTSRSAQCRLSARSKTRSVTGSLSKGKGFRTLQGEAANGTKGFRFVDAWDPKGFVAREVKTGLAGLTRRIQDQIDNDVLLRARGRFEAVEWHFYPSEVSGTLGPSSALLAELRKRNIPYVIHLP